MARASGRLLALILIAPMGVAFDSPLFLHPPTLGAVLAVFAGLFLLADLAAGLVARLATRRCGRRRSRRRGWRMRRNPPLTLGLILLAIVALIALFGPHGWRPPTRLKRNAGVLVNGEWVYPPYPPFAVPGFPLGFRSAGARSAQPLAARASGRR